MMKYNENGIIYIVKTDNGKTFEYTGDGNMSHDVQLPKNMLNKDVTIQKKGHEWKSYFKFKP